MAAEEDTTPAELQRLLEVQKAALRERGPPSVRERERRLDVMIQLLLANEDALVAAVTADFGVRPREVTRFADVLMALEAFKAARAGVRSWCRPERRRVDFPFNVVGATNYVEYQPKGVVGVIAPWNYPIMLLLTPVASAFAAGDAVLLKPSELAPRTAALIARLVNGAYDESIARVVLGGPRTSAALAALPLDHLVFTGSTRVGKLVAAACAQNLTPTTLELGGKCPVIVGRRADVAACAKRVVHGKILNSGQTCLAPDYVFVEESVRDAFVEAFERTIADMFPNGVLGSGDYASIISDAHGTRLRELTAEANAPAVASSSAAAARPTTRMKTRRARVAPTLILDAGDALRVSSEEIFGPLLVVRTYARLADALSYIAARPAARFVLPRAGPGRGAARLGRRGVGRRHGERHGHALRPGRFALRRRRRVGPRPHARPRRLPRAVERPRRAPPDRPRGALAARPRRFVPAVRPRGEHRRPPTSGSRCARCARPGAASCDALFYLNRQWCDFRSVTFAPPFFCGGCSQAA